MTVTAANAYWILPLIGLVAGIFSGAIGVGSGIIFIPALVLFLGMPQKVSQGTALTVMVPMALLGATRYWQNPEIQLKPITAALLTVGALAGVLIGTTIAARLPAHILRKIFSIFILVVAAKMLLHKQTPVTASPAAPTCADEAHSPEGGNHESE